MLDIIKAIIFGIVEGITEWLPISSTGHLIILEELLRLEQGEAFFEMFQVVIQLGAILAVVVLYFHKLNPFSPKKTQKQKMMTWQIWIKVVIGCVPAGVIGILFDDLIDKVFYHWYVVALMLIIYGVLFIVVENYQQGKEPRVLPAVDPDGPDHRCVPDAGHDPGYIQIRRDHRGRPDDRRVQKPCGGVYILPGDPGHVWGQPAEACQVRVRVYGNAGCRAARGHGGFLRGIHRGDQVPDELHKEK